MNGTYVTFNEHVVKYFFSVPGARRGKRYPQQLYFPYQYSVPEILERIRKWSTKKPNTAWEYVDCPFILSQTKKYVLNHYWHEKRDRKKNYKTPIPRIREVYIANDRIGDVRHYNNFLD